MFFFFLNIVFPTCNGGAHEFLSGVVTHIRALQGEYVTTTLNDLCMKRNYYHAFCIEQPL